MRLTNKMKLSFSFFLVNSTNVTYPTATVKNASYKLVFFGKGDEICKKMSVKIEKNLQDQNLQDTSS